MTVPSRIGAVAKSPVTRFRVILICTNHTRKLTPTFACVLDGTLVDSDKQFFVGVGQKRIKAEVGAIFSRIEGVNGALKELSDLQCH